MNDSFQYSPTRGSPLGSSRIFDPFLLGPNHQDHYNSTSIIKLDSGKIFCPICLDTTPVDEIYKGEQNLFGQYIRNLFDALDQYSETVQLRHIILPILGTILKIRPYKAKNDYEFHKYLRVIFKLLKSNQFSPKEFSTVTRIFFSVTTNFVTGNPLPLSSVWHASSQMLDYGKSILNEFANKNNRSSEDHIQFCGSLAIVIRTYLEALGRFSIEGTSDLIFQIYSNNVPETHCRKNYNDSQLKCLKYMTDILLPELMPYVTSNDTDAPLENPASCGNFFEALTECLRSSIRMKEKNFLELLASIDSLQLAYLLIRKNPDKDLRTKVKEFLKCYVLHFVEDELGADEEFMKFSSLNHSSIDPNSKNLIHHRRRPGKCEGIVFYILMNYVAIRQQSKYHVRNRVMRVINSFEPVDLDISESIVILKAYNYVVAMTIQNEIQDSSHVEKSMVSIWQNIQEKPRGHQKLNEGFCFDEGVFYFVYQHPVFVDIATVDTLRYMLEKVSKNEVLRKNLYILFRNENYKHLLSRYFIESEISSTILVKALSEDEDDNPEEKLPDDHLISELSAFLSALFHEAVLEASSEIHITLRNDNLLRLASIVSSLMAQCEAFVFSIEDRFVMDLFKLMERLHVELLEDKEVTEALTLLNEVITQLIRTNNPSLMKILCYLDFNLLGYMYQCLSDYVKGDQLSESIARLLVAYDTIDYPLRYQVAQSLYPMALSVFNWMLSQNTDLHHLSLIAVQKILGSQDTGKSTRVLLCTGLIHMIYSNPSAIDSGVHAQLFTSLSEFNELTYNPLLSRIISQVPEQIKHSFESKWKKSPGLDLQMNVSFEDLSGSSDIESEAFDMEGILNQIQDDEIHTVNAVSSVPGHIFAAKGFTNNNPTRIDVGGWERMAYETTKKYGGVQ